jgi:hypothetical protein
MSQGSNKGKPIPEEPVFTTMALGEEGDMDIDPDPSIPVWGCDEPVMTTMALGEEGDPDPTWPGEVTTMALGEEGDMDMDLWGT